MKIKIERIQKEKMSKRKKSGQFQWASIENGACPLALLSCSLAFGIYKNFTAIDQHTTHVKWL